MLLTFFLSLAVLILTYFFCFQSASPRNCAVKDEDELLRWKIKTVFRRLDTNEDCIISRLDFENIARRITKCHKRDDKPERDFREKAQSIFRMQRKLWQDYFVGGYQGTGKRPPVTENAFVAEMFNLTRDPSKPTHNKLFEMYAKIHNYMEFDDSPGVSLEDYTKWMQCQLQYEGDPEEAREKARQMTRKMFMLLDIDRNGVLSQQDFVAAVKKFYLENDNFCSPFNTIVYGQLVELDEHGTTVCGRMNST